MYLGQNIKQILPGNVAVGGANMGMVPLFSVQWCPSRAAIWAGYVAADGQELDDNLFPDAAAGIAANNVPTTSNANWLADPTARGAYVSGSSAGKFRVPDYNGKFAGSLGAVFLRGDGTLSAAVAGTIQRDALENIQGSISSIVRSTSYDSSTGAFGIVSGGTVVSAGSGGSATELNFDASRTVRTASETRPLNVTGCWVIKLFGAVTNMGSADAAQLASSYASLRPVQRTAVAASGTAIDFTGIPSWVKRVKILFRDVSTGGGSALIVRIGSGSVQSSGYTSGSISENNTAQASINDTTGFVMYAVSASNANQGVMTLDNISGNQWISAHQLYNTTNTMCHGTGGVSLSGPIDRIRLTTINGTDQFDAGTINIMYEG